jgi:hypothetical protein
MLDDIPRGHAEPSAHATREPHPPPERAPLAVNLLVGATVLLLLVLLAVVIVAI